ncbi:calmodulin-3 [Mayamaea pseudoterrestris]|nr:calmodulin-3 [Mayamaea pseudoterrestris]
MGLSEEQEKDFREIFDAYQKDKEGNDIGFVNKETFIKAVRACGFNPSEKEVATIKEGISDKAKIEDFMKVIEKKAADPPDKAEDLMECFRIFDKDGQGYISTAELKNILTNLGEKFSPEEWEEVEKSVGDGMIAYKDYVNMILG